MLLLKDIYLNFKNLSNPTSVELSSSAFLMLKECNKATIKNQ